MTMYNFLTFKNLHTPHGTHKTKISEKIDPRIAGYNPKVKQIILSRNIYQNNDRTNYLYKC